MTFRFLFVFGWLRVAETLYNPFGEDDDDFELNELLNRHFKVGDAFHLALVRMLCWWPWTLLMTICNGCAVL